MIKSERGSFEINGVIMDVIADYGMLTESIIKSVPEDIRLHIAGMLTEMLRLGIEQAMKGGEEKRKV